MRSTILIALAVTACATQRPPMRDMGPPTANPSAVVAAELAFARLARERGQWTAFRETALPEAEMFTPKRTLARDFLRGRADPAKSVSWTPHFVAISCDGRAAVSTGSARWPDGSPGYFTTIWLRERDGERWKWALDHGEVLKEPRPQPDAVRTRVAVCGSKPGIPITAAKTGVDLKVGVAPDQTLLWRSEVRPDGSRTVKVDLWTGAGFETVVEDRVPAAA